ncbi:hypothetical protein P3S67_015530 [Capsicum chacoense]
MDDDSSQALGVITSENVHMIESLNSTPEDDQLSTKRKSMLPRSLAWPHYEKFVEHGVAKAKCKYCGKVLKAASRNGTTGLNNHLKICPKIPNKVNTFKQKYINFPLQGEKGDGAS